MLPAFLSAAEQKYKSSSATVDWFHVAQLFTKAVDDARKLDARQSKLPDHSSWATITGAETIRTQYQENDILELVRAELRYRKGLPRQRFQTEQGRAQYFEM